MTKKDKLPQENTPKNDTDDIETFARELLKTNGENIGIQIDGTRYTKLETRFAIKLAEGFSPVKAWEFSGYSTNYSPKQLRKRALDSSNKDKIKTLVSKLRETIAQEHAVNLNTIINELLELKDRAQEKNYLSIELKCLQELSKIFNSSKDTSDNRVQQIFQFTPDGQVKKRDIDDENGN